VLAAEDIDLESEPEEGATALIAAASDALEAADKKAERAEKRARAAREALNALNAKLAELENGTEKAIIIDEHKELKQELTTAEEKAEKAFRSAAKAKTKAVDAQKTAEEIMDDAAVKKMPGKG
jgi:predicted  nucleic acid-binding Zn-ribbon protein